VCSDPIFRARGCREPWTAVRRIGAPRGGPSACYSLTSTINSLICWDDSGLWEDLVHYSAHFPPGSPDSPRSSDPSRTKKCTATTRHNSHSPFHPAADRRRPPQREYPRATDRITYRGDQMAAAASMTSRRTGPPAPADFHAPYRARSAACARLWVHRDARDARGDHVLSRCRRVRRPADRP
jgi:hypothetical protein